MRQTPLEYVGAAPTRRKRRHPLGGWLLIIFALILGGVFVRPLIPFLQAQQNLTSSSNLTETIEELRSEGSFASRLAAQALQRTQVQVTYDDSYYAIDFPNGDIPDEKGNRADLIVRAYRGVGIDLQEDVHADMSANFRPYPQIYGRKQADSNIDHRLVGNLQVFFTRKGQPLAVTDEPFDYSVGDIVVWRLVNGERHIGVVVPGPAALKSAKWIVHNMNASPTWEDRLLDYDVIGHYRYGH